MFAIGPVVVECTNWEHFEYRYKATGDHLAEARRAHKVLSKAIERHAGLDDQNTKPLFSTPCPSLPTVDFTFC